MPFSAFTDPLEASLPKRQRVARIKMLSDDSRHVHPDCAGMYIAGNQSVKCLTRWPAEPASKRGSQDGKEFSAAKDRSRPGWNRRTSEFGCADTGRRQGELPHELVRAGRAWRFLSGQGDRAVREG